MDYRKMLSASQRQMLREHERFKFVKCEMAHRNNLSVYLERDESTWIVLSFYVTGDLTPEG